MHLKANREQETCFSDRFYARFFRILKNITQEFCTTDAGHGGLAFSRSVVPIELTVMVNLATKTPEQSLDDSGCFIPPLEEVSFRNREKLVVYYQEMHLLENHLAQQAARDFGIDLAIGSRPAAGEKVSGDFVAAHFIGDKLYLLNGDVDGHGAKCAHLSAVIREYISSNQFKAFLGTSPAPDEILSNIDRYLNELIDHPIHAPYLKDKFVCMAVNVIDLRSHELLSCYGGLPPPIYFNEHGKAEELPIRGTILTPTFFAWPGSPVHSTPLAQGSTLVIRSDGVFDIHSKSGRVRVEQIIHRFPAMLEHTRESAEDTVNHLRRLVNRLSGGRPHEDDITLVVLHIPQENQAVQPRLKVA